MSDPTPDPEAPAATETTPPTGDPTPALAPAADATNGDTVTLTAAELQAKLDEVATKASQKANREAEQLRKRLKDIDDAALSDLEKAQQAAQEATDRATRLEAEAKQARTETAIERAARALGYADPTDAIALTAGQIEYDDAGQPTNVDELVKSIADAKPHLVAKPLPGGSPTNPPRGQGEPPKSDSERLADLRNRATAAAPAWGGGGVIT